MLGFSGQAMAYFINTDFVRAHLGDKSRGVAGVSKPPAANPGFSERQGLEGRPGLIAQSDGKRLASFINERATEKPVVRQANDQSAGRKRVSDVREDLNMKAALERVGYGLPAVVDHDREGAQTSPSLYYRPNVSVIPGVIPGTWVPGGWGPGGEGGAGYDEVPGVKVAKLRTYKDGSTVVMPPEAMPDVSPVPVPAPVFLLGSGLAALALLRRKQTAGKLS